MVTIRANLPPVMARSNHIGIRISSRRGENLQTRHGPARPGHLSQHVPPRVARTSRAMTCKRAMTGPRLMIRTRSKGIST